MPDPISGRFREGLHPVGPDRYMHWVRLGVVCTGLGYLLVLVGGLLLADKPIQSAFGEGGVVVTAAVAAAVVRRRTGLAAGLVIAAVWSELHWSLLLDGDMETSALLVFPAMIVGAGFLVGGRAALLLAAATTVSVPVSAWAGRALLGAPAMDAGDDLYKLLVLAPVLFATATLVVYGLRAMGDAVSAAESSERKIRHLVDHTPDGIVVLDGGGRVVSANPAAGRILGVDDAARGRTLAEVLRSAGDDEETRASLETLVSGSRYEPVALDLQSAGGDRVAVEATSERTAGGVGRVSVQVVFRDVTGRRVAEERATQIGRLLAESRHEVYVFEPESLEVVLTSRGARDNLGHEPERLGRLLMTEINPALTTAYVAGITSALGGEGVITTRGVHRRANGSVYPVEMQIQRARLDGREVLVAFVSDVSERAVAEEEQRRLQTQLEHAQRMEAVGRLAGGVAHDFNNLLTVVGGCAEVLREEAEGELQELAEEIIKAQLRGAGLTRQLLAFARREVTQPEVLELGAVLEEARSLLARLVGEQVVLELGADAGETVYADRGQFEQILLNLVSNSRDAMPLGGTIRITTTPAGAFDGELAGFVGLHVEDEGVGMDSAIADRACEPFFTTKARGQGTGLGLSTVHGIVTQNGGHLRLRSVPGEGTTVSVFWPLPPEDARSRADGADDEGVASQPRGRILVVEDDNGARELVKLILTRAGHHVTAVAEAASALDRLNEEAGDMDLVLTDVVMPGMSGIELAAEIRDRYPDVPVLLMSGYVDGEIESGALGAQELILKPFRAEELRRRVGGSLRTGAVGG